MLTLLLIGLGIGGAMIYFSLKREKQLREIKDQACSKIESAPQGLNEFQGFAWPEVDCPKNYNGNELVYYSFRLQKLVTKGYGKNKRREWETVFARAHMTEFYLVDPTGIVVVDPKEAETIFNAEKTRMWYSISDDEKKFYIENVINDAVYEFPPSTFLFGLFSSSFRIVEIEVMAGSPLYAKGDFRSDEEQIRKVKLLGLTNFAQKVFNLKARSIRKLDSLLDKNKDGKVSKQEAIEGYTGYAKLARRKVGLNSGASSIKEDEFAIWGSLQSSTNHKLILADSHENHLVDRLGKGNYFLLGSGSLILALSLSFLAGLF